MNKDKDIKIYEKFLEKCYFPISVNYSIIHLDSFIYPPTQSMSVGEVWSAWKRFPSHRANYPGGNLNFYTHIPYCANTCHFCCYSREELKNRKELNIYIKTLIKYYRFFRSVFQNTSFTNLYIGGGTPSILSTSMFKILFTELFASFKFDKDGQKAIEVSPETTSYNKLKLIREFGFNRISFGVQSFNEKTLRLNNRLNQTNNIVESVIKDAKKIGFEWINIDLLIGLRGDTAKDIFKSFKRAISLSPQSIHLYSLQPTPDYLTKICNTDKEMFFRQKQKIINSTLKDMCRFAKINNYIPPDLSEIALNLADPNAYVFNQTGLTQRKFYSFDDRYSRPHVFGLGYLSSSHINGKMRYQMQNKLEKSPSKYVFMGEFYDEKREMIVSILRNLSYRKFISRKEFRENFNKDILEEFGDAISKLNKLKVICIEKDKIQFKKISSRRRLLCALFFFDKHDILAAIKRSTASQKILLPFHQTTGSVTSKTRVASEHLVRSQKILKKINLLIKQSKKHFYVIGGVLYLKKKDKLIIQSDKLPASKKEIMIDENIFCTEAIFDNVVKPRFIHKKEISYKELSGGDHLSLIVYKELHKIKCLIIKKIVAF